MFDDMPSVTVQSAILARGDANGWLGVAAVSPFEQPDDEPDDEQQNDPGPAPE